MDGLAKLKKLTTYSRKNHGINAHLQPRRYYLAYEDVEQLIKELEAGNEELKAEVRDLKATLVLRALKD